MSHAVDVLHRMESASQSGGVSATRGSSPSRADESDAKVTSEIPVCEPVFAATKTISGDLCRSLPPFCGCMDCGVY